MKKDAYRLAAIAVLLIAGLFLGARYYLSNQRAAQAGKIAEQVKTDASIFVRFHSRTLGPADAKVTVVEFFDPECESCREVYPEVKALLARYGQSVRLVHRYMPLHPNSVYAAGALEAAGAQGRYWEMLEMLFAYQPQWASHHEPRPDFIPTYAQKLGLDMTAFEAFIQAGSHKALVEIDRADGQRLGVTATPVFFVNGKMLQPLSLKGLADLIEEELARPR